MRRCITSSMIGLLFVFSFFIGACQSETTIIDQGSGMSIPIQMEIPAGKLQPIMGLSGFILGTFMMLDAYLLIFLSCTLLIIKDATMEKILMALRTVLQMLNPQILESKAMVWIGTLSQNDTRVQYGTIGLVASMVLAYFGAWIAL